MTEAASASKAILKMLKKIPSRCPAAAGCCIVQHAALLRHFVASCSVSSLVNTFDVEFPNTGRHLGFDSAVTSGRFESDLDSE